MKTFAALFFCALALNSNCQTNHAGLVTNWIAPGPNHRIVAGQVYDIERSQKWASIFIESGTFAYLTKSRAGRFPPPGEPVSFWYVKRDAQGAFQSELTIDNIPWNPNDFTTDDRGDFRAKSKRLKLFLVSSNVSWGADGKVAASTRVFDYGLQATNKIPIVMRASSPAIGTPTTAGTK